MKFFTPGDMNEAEQLDFYQKIKDWIVKFAANPLSKRRIYSLHYHHNGIPYVATVGTMDPIENELIFAIFYDETRDCYLVCTPHRGAFGGDPILVGNVQSAQDFE